MDGCHSWMHIHTHATRPTILLILTRCSGCLSLDDHDWDDDMRPSPKPTPHPRRHLPRPLPPSSSSLRSSFLWASLLVVILQSSWFVYYFQFLHLPSPLSPSDAGKRGFSELRAYQHVQFLTRLGPHPVGSQALEKAIQYVLSNVKDVQADAPWDVDVESDYFHAQPGVTHLRGGLFKGKSLIYANLRHVVVRVKPASVSGAKENSVLVSSHIDTVISAPGAGDCNSNIGVMLELLRAISHWAHGFKHSVIFLFNTGEEEGLDGAHGFITQHPWNSSIRTFIDLESIGVGGRSTLFQGGPAKGIVELYAKVAKHPSAQIAAQDIFLSGFVKSATDFQVYKEVANLSGLDFAFMQNVAVYHTKNDKIELLTPGSLQHVGDNILALLLAAGVSDDLPNFSAGNGNEASKMESIYFDILGKYLIIYTREFAKHLYSTLIAQSLLLLLMSLFQGGLTSVKTFSLSTLCLLYSWVGAVTLSFLSSLGLSVLSTTTVPYIAHPWLAIGLFGSPALFGALVGHYFGFSSLKKHLFNTHKRTLKKSESTEDDAQKLSNEIDLKLATWDAERWLFKAGIVQWIGILIIGTWLEVGASYIAVSWIVCPAVAYGLIDATFSPRRRPQELRSITLMAALPVPLIVTAGIIIRLFDLVIGNLVRFDRNPGLEPIWLGNAVVAILAAITVCLFLVYLLPYAYRAGGFKWIICGLAILYFMTLSIVTFEILPPFTEHYSRALNVVQVVEIDRVDNVQAPAVSYVSISSITPGTLRKELAFIQDEGFVCGKDNTIDMVTYTIKYGCIGFVTKLRNEAYMNEYPTLDVSEGETVNGHRVKSIVMDTKMARRWVMAINTTDLKLFQLEAINRTTGGREILFPMGSVNAIDGWHTIQFVTDQAGPSLFQLSLIFYSSVSSQPSSRMEQSPLLKLRTDVNQITSNVDRTLRKLPSWVTRFGKSTEPYPLAYLVNLPRTSGSGE